MSFSLSIFDVFANAVPGSLYLVATIFVSIRLGWIDWADLAGLDTTIALVGGVVASYVLGQVLAPSLQKVVERVPLGLRSYAELRADFERLNPSLVGRPFIDANPFTLLAGLRQVSPEAASEVDRSRASGIMLRSSSGAFLVGAVIAFVVAIADWEPAAVAAGVAFVALAGLALREGHIRSGWTWMHTYECATWIPDVDARLAPPSD